MIALQLLSFLFGLWIVFLTIRSAVRTYLLPRAAPDPISGATFLTLRTIFHALAMPKKNYFDRDRLLAYFVPFGLLGLLAVWLTLILTGYTFMFWALSADISTLESWGIAFLISGSSLFTLGNATVETVPQKLLSFSEAALGPTLIALLIGYMPTIYGAFSKRETLVNLLEVRAGSPPCAVDMICRYHRLRGIEHIHEVWLTWEVWFSELDETHTSLAMLNFLRSPVPEHSWVNAAAAVLDAAAIVWSTVDTPRDVQAALCLRGGYIALRRIADYFRVEYDPDPKPSDPISVTRAEYDRALELLAAEEVPLKEDRDQAWKDFAGWRVNYDAVILALARLTDAPPAPWTSAEMREQRRPPLFGRGS